jgi:hypothetical protein
VKRLKLALICAAALTIATAAPVGAITYGEPDAGEHPYVGLMIFFVPNEPGWFSCSGTLLNATVFLTAGHCTFDIGTDGEAEGTSGGNDVWVTVAPEDVLEGFPARADYPDEATLYAARSAWLDANPDYITGTAFPSPLYDNFAAFPANHDVGIVVLDEAVVLGSYGELAPLGSVETLIAESSPGRNDAIVETVGYGIQAIQPNPLNVDTRYKSTSRIVQNKSSIAGGGNLHTLNNPSAVGGVGGSCFGDSGGPVLINNTNEVLAVVSFGFSPTCHGADYSWRVDIQESYDFILPFLD